MTGEEACSPTIILDLTLDGRSRVAPRSLFHSRAYLQNSGLKNFSLLMLPDTTFGDSLCQGANAGEQTTGVLDRTSIPWLRHNRQVSRRLGIYLVNSVNPFRLEGQKAIMYRVLESLAWEPPEAVMPL